MEETVSDEPVTEVCRRTSLNLEAGGMQQQKSTVGAALLGSEFGESSSDHQQPAASGCGGGGGYVHGPLSTILRGLHICSSCEAASMDQSSEERFSSVWKI